MFKKAVSKAVIQVALVTGLVLVANAIKPFSLGNLVLHTLSAAQSLSFVLPSAAVNGIERANYLAKVYSKRLMDGDQITPDQIDLVALNDDVESFDGAEIKDVNPGDRVKKQTSTKRSTRRVRPENRQDNHGEVSARNANAGGNESLDEKLPVVSTADSIAMVEPMLLPVFRPAPVKAQLTPASLGLSLSTLPARLNTCKTIEVKEVKLIALIQQSQQSAKLKIGVVADQPARISLQCREEEKVNTEVTESVLETTTTTGPEEELFLFDQSTSPSVTAPKPECSRVP